MYDPQDDLPFINPDPSPPKRKPGAQKGSATFGGANALNRLIRTQNKIVPPDNELQEILNQAIDDVTEEFGLKERFGNMS